MLTICTHYTLQGPSGDVTELLTFCQDSCIFICSIHTLKFIYSFKIKENYMSIYLKTMYYSTGYVKFLDNVITCLNASDLSAPGFI